MVFSSFRFLYCDTVRFIHLYRFERNKPPAAADTNLLNANSVRKTKEKKADGFLNTNRKLTKHAT